MAAHIVGDAMATRLTVCFHCEVELKKQRPIHSYIVALTYQLRDRKTHHYLAQSS